MRINGLSKSDVEPEDLGQVFTKACKRIGVKQPSL